MFNLRRSYSKFYDQSTFDDQFMRDLQKRYHRRSVSQNCPSRKIYSNTSPAQKARRDNIT